MDRDALIDDLIRDEGLRLKPYRDTVGKLTIGIGRNLDDVGISSDEAELLAQNDIDSVMADLDRALPWWRQMDDVRQRALANMAFNLGISRLIGFKNTLAYLKAGDYEAAAVGALDSKWAKQVGVRADRIAGMIRHGSHITGA